MENVLKTKIGETKDVEEEKFAEEKKIEKKMAEVEKVEKKIMKEKKIEKKIVGEKEIAEKKKMMIRKIRNKNKR